MMTGLYCNILSVIVVRNLFLENNTDVCIFFVSLIYQQ